MTNILDSTTYNAHNLDLLDFEVSVSGTDELCIPKK